MSTINVNIDTPEILNEIETKFGVRRDLLLQAIQIRSVGFEHVNTLELDGTSNTDILPEDIKTILPNSRLAIYFGLVFAAEPKINWITKKGSVTKITNALSVITLENNGLYQFDIIASNKLKYNMQATLDSTFVNLIIVEFAIGL